jgi:alkylation response protein AidB-like acyl-CoA dehydrogenase
MNFDLDDDHRDLAAAVRDFLSATDSLQRARAVLDGAPAQNLAPGRQGWIESGFATITVPEAAGGGGGTLLDQVVAAEQAGRVLAGPSLVSYVRAASLLTDDKDRLTALAAGELQVAVVDDRNAVLDAMGANTFLLMRGEDLVCATGSVQPRPPIDPTRMLARVRLDDGEVVAHAAGDRWRWARDVGRVVLAAEGLGTAARAVELGVEYARQRVAFGRPIGSYQAVKHALVDAYVQLEHLRSLVWWAAWAGDHSPGQLPLASAAAKAAAARTLQQVTDTLIQVHGGIGFTWEHDAHLYWRRARADRLLIGDEVEALDQVATLALAGADAGDPGRQDAHVVRGS